MHTHPKVAAVASQNWPFRHDAKCEPLLKFLKANIHEASSHAYPLNLPTQVREDRISKEPLGPVVRQGDEQWALIVKWTQFAMLNAEELRSSSKTLEQALKSQKPAVKRLVGTEGNLGEQIGLSTDWVVRIVRAVGNYGEVFDHNVGPGSKLAIPRGLNHLWTSGGIQYAPPLQ